MTTFHHPTPTYIPVPYSFLYHIYLSPYLNIGRDSLESGAVSPRMEHGAFDIFIIFVE